MRFDPYGYGPVASFYDRLAAVYSRGRIGESKRVHLAYVKPGMRIAYPGVGSGQEAILAARQGAFVTGLDLSPEMLDRFRTGIAGSGAVFEAIECDASRYVPEEPFDLVAAHYFLNPFEAKRACAFFDRLATWLRPGGRIVLSDFARPGIAGAGRWVGEAYYRPVNWIAWALGFCALHEVLDLRALLEAKGFRIIEETRFPVFGNEQPAFVTVIGEKGNAA